MKWFWKTTSKVSMRQDKVLVDVTTGTDGKIRLIIKTKEDLFVLNDTALSEDNVEKLILELEKALAMVRALEVKHDGTSY